MHLQRKKISVIIPIYTINPLILRDTLDSVLHQDFESFEVIAVNDGSDIATQNVIKEYEEKYNSDKFIALHQENQGGAIALNYGLKHARSTYIAFCDYDDLMFPGALRHMYNLAEAQNAEIVMGRMQRFDGDASMWPPIEQFLGKERIITNLNEDMRLYFVSFYWAKLFNTNFLKKHHIIFDDMKVADIPFVHKAYFHASKIIVTSQLVHLWRHNKTSISFDETGFKDYIDIFSQMINYIDQHKIDVDKKIICVKYLLSAICKYPKFKHKPELVTYFETHYTHLLRQIFQEEKQIYDLKFLAPAHKNLFVNLFTYGTCKAIIAQPSPVKTLHQPEKISYEPYFSEIEKISAQNGYPKNIEHIKHYSANNEISDYEKIISPLTPPDERSYYLIDGLKQNKHYAIPSTGKNIFTCFHQIKTHSFVDRIYNQAKMNTLLNKRVVLKKDKQHIFFKELEPQENIDICFGIWIDRMTMRTPDRNIFLQHVFEAALEMGLSILPWMTIGINAIPNLPKATLTITPHTIGNGNKRYAHYKVGYLPDFRYFENHGYSAWSQASDFMKNDISTEQNYEAVKTLIYKKYKDQRVSRLGQSGKASLPKAKFIFVPLQMPEDTVAQHAYFDIYDAIKILANHYQAQKYVICVKKHPLDASEYTKNMLINLATLSNVHIISGNIHDYIEKAEYIVTVNSGVGLESLFWQKTVISIGDCDYKSVTHHATSIDAFKSILHKGVTPICPNVIKQFIIDFFTLGLVHVNSKEQIKQRLYQLYGHAIASKEDLLYKDDQSHEIDTSQVLDLLKMLKAKLCNDTLLEILNQINGVSHQLSLNTPFSASPKSFPPLKGTLDLKQIRQIHRDVFVPQIWQYFSKQPLSAALVAEFTQAIERGIYHKSDIIYAIGEHHQGMMFIFKVKYGIYSLWKRILRLHKIRKIKIRLNKIK